MIIFLILITVVFSVVAFQRSELFYKYLLSPYEIIHRKKWYQTLTHGFLHAGWEHLLVNMFVLFSFGQAIEIYFHVYLPGNKNLLIILFYLSAIVISSIPSILKNRNNSFYTAVGASGAVSAVTFATIVFDPMRKILFFGILPIPGIIFGILYLAYSYYMSKKGGDNIGHDAHFYGAIYGFVFPLLLNRDLIAHFFQQLF